MMVGLLTGLLSLLVCKKSSHLDINVQEVKVHWYQSLYVVQYGEFNKNIVL